MKMIPHSRPTIGYRDIKAVSSVFRSGLIAQGSVVKEFEDAFSEYNGVKGGVAVSSGTAAIHAALLALGVGSGDSVIIPSYSCIAPCNAVRYTGARPVLADCANDGWDIDAEWVERYLKLKTKSRRVKAIIIVHLFGKPVNLDDFMDLSKRYSIPIIEDCALSVGAEYKGRKVGSFGEISVFSFYATKVMTTGEGGMIVSNSKELLRRARDLREYDQKGDNTLRFNYKMTDFQAALGISQLKRLPEFIKKRRWIAKKYMRGMDGLPFSIPGKDDPAGNIFFRFVIKTDAADRFIQGMHRKGILCRRPVFMPVHRITGHRILPHAEHIWEKAVSLPIYPSLSEDLIGRIIAGTKIVMKGFEHDRA